MTYIFHDKSLQIFQIFLAILREFSKFSVTLIFPCMLNGRFYGIPHFYVFLLNRTRTSTFEKLNTFMETSIKITNHPKFFKILGTKLLLFRSDNVPSVSKLTPQSERLRLLKTSLSSNSSKCWSLKIELILKYDISKEQNLNFVIFNRLLTLFIWAYKKLLSFETY